MGSYLIKNLEGRPHVVVPVTMIVEGVLNGSHGPLMYPRSTLRNVRAWNGRPVVVHHPTMEANGLADDPVIYNKQKIGTLFNAGYDAKRRALVAEAWIDKARVQSFPQVHKAIRAGRALEVSTGVITDNDEIAGTFNGRDYLAVVRSMHPDHLAILPGLRGACDRKMGCGTHAVENVAGSW